ncbi:DUF4249 domain-containing protein [Ancylomarina sp.]|uniref:DUF4249 domain-containing protein n=1 Tax=Ancylomarina sp. TaxID=1970196 RepID=UPI003564E0E0
MPNIKTILFIIFSLILFSCTEKFYTEIDEDVSILVVDGKITDDNGNPCEVRLFRTVKFTDDFSLEPERDAIVILHDDLKQTEILTEFEAGIYRSSSNEINGTIGHSYWIEIQTIAGDKYESTPEKMNSPFEINSIYGDEQIFITGENSKEKGVGIYFDATNQNNKASHLRWEYRESYEWHSPFKVEDKFSEDATTICFPVNDFPLINIYDASDLAKKEVNHLLTSEILQTEVKLEHIYLLDMHLYSTTRENYEFWENMKAINQTNGNIYDVLPANIQGNISSCENNCEVLGYFEASSVRKMKRFFTKNEFSLEFSDFDKSCEKFMKRYDMRTPPPPPDIYKIINSYQENTEMVYIVRWRYCYECNVIYPVNKPSFWP